MIRTFVFYLYLNIWTVIFGVLFSPTLLLSNRSICWACKIWAKLSLLGLRVICGVTYQVGGLNNLPKESFILASKHQSAFETIFFWMILDRPVYVLKRELIFLPIFGLYLLRLGMIYINRKAGSRALKHIVDQSKLTLAQRNATIIIFPEGTRTKAGNRSERYFPGLGAIYTANHHKVVPVALNSGFYWPSRGFVIKPGKVLIKILPAIKPGLSREEFGKLINEQIEHESLKLTK